MLALLSGKLCFNPRVHSNSWIYFFLRVRHHAARSQMFLFFLLGFTPICLHCRMGSFTSNPRYAPRWVAQRPGAEGLPSQLCYHAKAEVAVVRRIGFSRSYKPSATLKRRTFSLKHGVCSKRGCGHARVLHDISSLRLHARHEVLPMVCCQIQKIQSK